MNKKRTCHFCFSRQEVMEELLELQKVKEKEQVEQTRSLKEANAQIKRQKYDHQQMSQKVEYIISTVTHLMR